MKRKLISLVLAGTAVLGFSACNAGAPHAEIASIFGDRAAEATAIAECESGLNPLARSAGGGNHGLFQINSVHDDTFMQVTGQPWTAVYDAHWNTVFAKYLFDQSGWSPWACERVL
jgi:hypothetical protein